MLFNSFTFLVFLPTAFVVYWILQRFGVRAQNLMLLVASYIFYGWWDYRFLSLIVTSSTVDYVVGRLLYEEEQPGRRRLLVLISIIVNLGLLGFFKYFNFFISSFTGLLNALGLYADTRTLSLILPVGISFYTFQTLSYTIDIYRRRITPTSDPIAFFTFVAFFPQLVAGPIERARNLLPQFLSERSFDVTKAKDGLRQILWGFFKKVVIADNLAGTVHAIFAQNDAGDALSLFLGTFFFAFQIYCDFSGYTDIAIGTARLFGFSLMRNFAYPYYSRDIAEFWRRWHISLSSWFRDYVYIPLGGSRAGTGRRILNILVTFTVSGFWHGANWTFVIWGLLNGIYYIPLMITNRQKRHTDIVAEGKLLPTGRDIVSMGITFLLVLIAWVFFRADSLGHAWRYLARMLTIAPGNSLIDWSVAVPLLGYVVGLVIWEWFQREKSNPLDIADWPAGLRWLAYLGIALSIALLGNLGEVQFIYFQF